MPSWRTIALNEFKMMTSRFRKYRKLFISFLSGLSIIYAVFLAPTLVKMLLPSDVAFIRMLLYPMLPPMLKLIILMLFVYCVISPLASSLREIDVSHLEIIASTPVRPHQVLFGTFIGRVILYVFLVIIGGGTLTAFLAALWDIPPLNICIILLCILFTVFIGVWIGTLISAAFVVKLGKTARGKEIGRALIMVFSAVIGIGFYASWFFVSQIAGNPVYDIVMQVFPSTWASEIITYFSLGVNPVLDVWVNLMLIVLVGGTLVLAGYKWAERFYDFEPGVIEVKKVKGESFLFKLFRSVSPTAFTDLVIFQIKDFVRSLENVSKIGYSLAFTVFYIFLFPMTGADLTFMGFFIPWFFGYILAVFMGSEITVKGKEKLWLFKKAPNGVQKLVFSKLARNLVLGFPLGVAVSIALIVIYQMSLDVAALTLLYMFVSIFSAMATCIGLFLINPAFKERSSKYGINMLIFLGISMGEYFIPIAFISLGIMPFSVWEAVTMTIALAISIVMLFLGAKKLESLE
ncbi:MAG: hypothetical protein ACTSSJ_00980 [Candidatus Odinarchaeia archaeon]